MSKGGHRLTITLRDRNPHEAELWERIEPMLKRKQFNQYAVSLLIEELVLDEDERRQRRYYRKLLEHLVFQGEPGAEAAATLQQLISTGMTAVEGNFIELKKE